MFIWTYNSVGLDAANSFTPKEIVDVVLDSPGRGHAWLTKEEAMHAADDDFRDSVSEWEGGKWEEISDFRGDEYPPSYLYRAEGLDPQVKVFAIHIGVWGVIQR